MPSGAFVPVLVVVDFQEDFCPPNGSLAVVGGRDIAGAVNELLSLPSFVLRVATQDWHPPHHVSFAQNHPAKKPFVDVTTIANPHNPAETCDTRLWPVHCVQGTKGAELVPELDLRRVDHVLKKGHDPRVEMYSAFYGPFRSPRVCDSGLAALLRDKGVTHVYVVGLALDFCVRCTAADAVAEGFATYVVEEATRGVATDGPAAWAECVEGLEKDGVKVVSMAGDEVQRLRRP